MVSKFTKVPCDRLVVPAREMCVLGGTAQSNQQSARLAAPAVGEQPNNGMSACPVNCIKSDEVARLPMAGE